MPDHWIYYKVVVDVIQFMKHVAADIHDIAKITFDNRAESEFNLTLVYANLREENPDWKEHLADELQFACSRTNPRVQIGDLFAREAMKDLDNLIGPVKRAPRKSWIALRDTRRFYAYKESTDWFRDLEKHLPALARSEGFFRADYEAWLKQRNRQDNLTAYIEFYHWHKTRKG